MVAVTNSSRIALITGANRGIGRATALALARDGIDVIVAYRSHADEAAAVLDEITSLGRQAVSLQIDIGATDTFDAFVASVTDALRDTWGRETFDPPHQQRRHADRQAV
jgi:NAD(P)-dependent dehydrogenase (short-subunit alcohol dehydrogenase family)